MESTSSDAPSEAVFRKPSRGARGNARQKRVREDDDASSSAAADTGDGGDGPASSLEMMRELQRQRQRARGVTLEAKGVADDVEAVLAAGGADAEPAAEQGLASTFTTQTDSGEVDPNMLRYIEEQMQQQGGGGDMSGGGVLDPEEAELYTTPAHLLAAVPGGSNPHAQEESASRWLAGIVEVSLGTEAKMDCIEAAERAKRQMMQKASDKEAFRRAEQEREHQLTIPMNFNSNFHQHRREHAIKRRGDDPSGGGGGGGGKGGTQGGHGGARNMSSDSQAYGRYMAKVRNERRN